MAENIENNNNILPNGIEVTLLDPQSKEYGLLQLSVSFAKRDLSFLGAVKIPAIVLVPHTDIALIHGKSIESVGAQRESPYSFDAAYDVVADIILVSHEWVQNIIATVDTNEIIKFKRGIKEEIIHANTSKKRELPDHATDITIGFMHATFPLTIGIILSSDRFYEGKIPNEAREDIQTKGLNTDLTNFSIEFAEEMTERFVGGLCLLTENDPGINKLLEEMNKEVNSALQSIQKTRKKRFFTRGETLPLFLFRVLRNADYQEIKDFYEALKVINNQSKPMQLLLRMLSYCLKEDGQSFSFSELIDAANPI